MILAGKAIYALKSAACARRLVVIAAVILLCLNALDTLKANRYDFTGVIAHFHICY